MLLENNPPDLHASKLCPIIGGFWTTTVKSADLCDHRTRYCPPSGGGESFRWSMCMKVTIFVENVKILRERTKVS